MTSVVVREYRHILRLLLRNKKISLSGLQNVRRYYTGTMIINDDMLHSVSVFLSNETEYRRLMNLYNPLNQLTRSEQISKTANHVGLKVPE